MPISDATVMLVDDEPSILELYENFLEDAAGILTASSGEEALQEIGNEVDVVILDRRMPNQSGDEVLEKIRDRGYECPVILATAISPGENITSLRYNEYLEKPVSRDELRTVVAQALQLSNMDIIHQEYFALMDKLLALENELSLDGIYHDPEYQKILESVQDLRDQINGDGMELESQIANRLCEKWPDARHDPWLA